MLNTVARKTAAFALTAVTGFALTVMPSGQAEASTVTVSDTNPRISATTLNPVCKAGDTVYRVKVTNGTKRWQDFSYNKTLVQVSGVFRFKTVAGGVMLEPGGSNVFRFRVRPMQTVSYNVNLNVKRSTETLEVLAFAEQARDVCN